MAKYIDNNGSQVEVDLLSLGNWKVATREEFEKEDIENEDFDEMLEKEETLLFLTDTLIKVEDIITNFDPVYPDMNLRADQRLIRFKFTKVFRKQQASLKIASRNTEIW